jgi:hypothetical protein
MAKQKIRTWSNPGKDKGFENTEKSVTMPDMQSDPRTVLENHVRGINPITGAVLDNAMYYGDNILPYRKDLTFEELKIKRAALENQAAQLQKLIDDQKTDSGVQENGDIQKSESSTENDIV